MTPCELANKLKSMYENAPDGESTTMIHLFGILYADELSRCDAPMRRIAKNATGKDSYATEINKGIRLTRYVDIKNECREKLIKLGKE